MVIRLYICSCTRQKKKSDIVLGKFRETASESVVSNNKKEVNLGQNFSRLASGCGGPFWVFEKGKSSEFNPSHIWHDKPTCLGIISGSKLIH